MTGVQTCALPIYGPLTEEQMEQVKESVDPHPPGWMYDKFSYLTKGGFWNKPEGWESVGPQVAKPESQPETEEPEWKDAEIKEDNPILAMGIDVIDRPGDYLADGEKEAMRAWKAANPDDTVKHQRRLFNIGVIDKLPWEDKIVHEETFGDEFPEDPLRGDTHVLTAHFPNQLYKFNGERWILVDKSNNNNYTYDEAYIDHLITKIESGEYDPELLSDNERDQIADRLNQSRT